MYDLTLDGVSIGGSQESSSALYAGQSVNMTLSGANNFGTENDRVENGIYCMGAVTVSGSGSLGIVTDGNGVYTRGGGIVITGSETALRVSAGAAGGNGALYGLRARGGMVEINNAQVVVEKRGQQGDGIWASNDIRISGDACVNVIDWSEADEDPTCGLHSDRGSVVIGGNAAVDIVSQSAGIYADENVYIGYVYDNGSYSVSGSPTVKVNDPDSVAAAGDGFTPGAVGIYGRENVKISDGLVAVNAGSDGDYTAGGIMGFTLLEISGGTVSASARGNDRAFALAGGSAITLSGGTVTAHAESNGAHEIGAYGIVTEGSVTLSGSVVAASAEGTVAYGICSNSSTEITGGSVTASGSSQAMKAGEALSVTIPGYRHRENTASPAAPDTAYLYYPDSAFATDGETLQTFKYVHIAEMLSISQEAAEHGSFTVACDGVAAASAAVGETVTLSAQPDAGYALASWNVYRSGDNTTAVAVTDNAFVMPDYPVTVSALFSFNSYAVTYYNNYEPDTVYEGPFAINHGSSLTAPAAPARSGYTFGGWYEEAACTNPWAFDSDTVTADTNLYAKWTRNSSGGGASPPSRTISVTEDSSPLFSGSAGAIKAEANMDNAFSNSVEVKVTDTQTDAGSFGLGAGMSVYPFDISLYVKGTDTKTEPADGYAVTISLPVPENLLDVKNRLSVLHKGDNGTVTTLSSTLKQIGGVWYLVFEATEFSPYALAAPNTGSYDESAGLPYYMEGDGRVFIGFAANGTYIAPAGKTVSLAPNEKTFSDIAGHWALSNIRFVTGREIFVGTGENTFSPDTGMTRAMFATVIGRLYERSFNEITDSGEHAFTDCDYDAYYSKYVDWAAENNILTGIGDSRFAPEREITREQMAAILHRFADFLGVLPDNMDVAPAYPDAETISGYAQSAALYCQTTGIIAGRDGGLFAPRETATRAEVAAIMERFVESVLA